MLIIVIVLCTVTSGLLLVWMGTFEYTVFRLQHNYPAYYKSIGQPRLRSGFVSGMKATIDLLYQWYRAIPAGFPDDRRSIRAASLYRLAIRYFFWGLLISLVAFGMYS
jgi:hypothetical protein